MTTSDELALLARALEFPWDRAPWLVYCDWLEERGRPDLAALVRDPLPAIITTALLQPTPQSMKNALYAHRGPVGEHLAVYTPLPVAQLVPEEEDIYDPPTTDKLALMTPGESV